MPDTLYRVKYNFRQQGTLTYAWSMSFWALAPDLDKVKAKASSLATQLNAITGTQTVVANWVIQDKTDPRKGLPVAGAFDPGDPGNAKDSDFPTTSALLYLKSSGSAFTKMQMRGLPDDVIKAGKLKKTAAVWATALPGFINELTGGGGGANIWRIRNYNTVLPERAITTVDLTLGLITATGHGFGPGTVTKCRVKGIKAPKSLNGQRNLYAVDANTLQIIGVSVPIEGGPLKLVSTASLREVAYVNSTIIDVEFIRASKRNVRRPL